MSSMNRVFLMGNLTRDPEMKTTPTGAKVTTFGLAMNRVFTDKAGEKHEDVCFITVVVWGKAADACGEFLTKGRPVLVEGRLQYRTWDDKDGAKHSVHEIVADRVHFLGSKPGAQDHSPAEEQVPF